MARSRVPARRDSRPARTPRVAGTRQRLARTDGAPSPETAPVEAADTATAATATTTAAGPTAPARPGRRPRPRPYPVTEADPALADRADGDGADADREDADGADTGAPGAARAGVPRVWWAVTALAVAAVAVGVFTTVVLLRWQRVEARATARAQVPSLAKTYAATILSYDYRHVRQDAEAAARVTTGEYGRQYRQTMDQLIIPQAQQVHAVVRAEVLSAGVSSVSDDGRQTTVLVYVNQTVSNDNVKGTRVDQVRVRFTLVRTGDSWKVSKVDPL